jgi:hypothetical protein
MLNVILGSDGFPEIFPLPHVEGELNVPRKTGRGAMLLEGYRSKKIEKRASKLREKYPNDFWPKMVEAACRSL